MAHTPTTLTAGRPTQVAGLTPQAGFLSILPVREGRGRELMELVRQIRDYNADASKAISNVLRLANSGYDVRALNLQGEPDPAGQVILDELLDPNMPRIAREYGGGLDVLIDMTHLTVATQGAMAMEVELTEDTRDIEDIIAVNPWLIDFQRDPETLRWEPGIRRLGSFEPLHPLQFRYIPLDPEPGDPRGRSPFWSALDIVFFQMEVLRDLKAAVHFAGYPRIDISVAWDAVLQAVKATRPDLLEADKAEDLRDWLDNYLGDIADDVNDLNPDDAFIHFDAVKAQYVIPTGRTINLQELMQVIDNQIVAGLKQLPILLGRNEGATTTHATVQWQVFVRELQAFQRVSQRLLEWALTLCLRVRGVQGRVELVYQNLRTTDRESEARAAAMETATAWQQVTYGWIDNDEAAMANVGHEAVSEPLLLVDSAEPSEEMDDDEEEGRALPGLDQRQRETIGLLPAWQQALYLDAEDSYWQLYRARLRLAWQRMEETLEAGEDPAPPERTPVVGVYLNGQNKFG